MVSIQFARSQTAGTTVTVRGIVTTDGVFHPNLRYIQDGTAGIAVFSSSIATLQPGDSVEVSGTLKDYNNLLEIDPVTNVKVISNGNPLPAPKSVSLTTGFDENYQGQIVEFAG